jgi:hypothetical protein
MNGVQTVLRILARHRNGVHDTLKAAMPEDIHQPIA